MSQRKKQILAGALVFLFALYYANSHFFYHTYTKDGVTVTHSHIHDKAHAQNGSHSQGELSLISFLSTFQSFQALICFFGIGGLFLLFTAIFRIDYKESPVSTITGTISLRAPPAIS